MLEGLSVVAQPGKTLALVGESGSGKSTLVALAERFYDPSKGAVLFDGVDIRELNIGWLRDQMGLVNQVRIEAHRQLVATSPCFRAAQLCGEAHDAEGTRLYLRSVCLRLSGHGCRPALFRTDHGRASGCGRCT